MTVAEGDRCSALSLPRLEHCGVERIAQLLDCRVRHLARPPGSAAIMLPAALTSSASSRLSATMSLVAIPCRHAPLAFPFGAPLRAPWNRHTLQPVTAGARHRDHALARCLGGSSPWAAAGMLETKAGFRRLKAYRHLPALRRALAEHTSHRLDRSGLLPNRASATHV